MNERSVHQAYTDGSSIGNPGPAGWAVVLDGRPFSGSITTATNNEAEMAAVLKVFELVPPNSDLDIVTDSRLVVGWFTRGWKIRNPKIRATKIECDTLRSDKDLKVSFRHTKGHASDQQNRRADMLARGEARAAKRLAQRP